MIKPFLRVVLAAMLTVPALADDSERIDHFRGEQPESWKQAVTLYTEYNAELRKILAREKLTTQDSARIHELTYTIENALEYMEIALSATEDSLEELHLASESTDLVRTRLLGQEYLSDAPGFE